MLGRRGGTLCLETMDRSLRFAVLAFAINRLLNIVSLSEIRVKPDAHHLRLAAFRLNGTSRPWTLIPDCALILPVIPTRQEKDDFCFGDFEGCSIILAQLMDRAAARPSLVATGLPVAIRATSSTKDTDIAPHSSTTESDI